MIWTDWDSYYEGHSMEKVTLPVRLFKLLGVELLVGKMAMCVWLLCACGY